jgi:hypothetical protein
MSGAMPPLTLVFMADTGATTLPLPLHFDKTAQLTSNSDKTKLFLEIKITFSKQKHPQTKTNFTT